MLIMIIICYYSLFFLNNIKFVSFIFILKKKNNWLFDKILILKFKFFRVWFLTALIINVLISNNLNATFKTRINPIFSKLLVSIIAEDKNTCRLVDYM